MSGSATSGWADDPTFPVIPTSLVEVDVVDRWREGVPAAVPLASADGQPDLDSAAEPLGVEPRVLDAVGAVGTAAEVRTVPLPESRFGWVVGVGDGAADRWRRAGAALARAIRDRLGDADTEAPDPEDLGDAVDADYVQIRLPAEVDTDTVAALTLGLSLGDYRFRVTGQPTPPRLRKALLVTPEGADAEVLRAAVTRARHWAVATALARDLANAPSNIKDPAWLAGTAARLAGEIPGLRANVRDEKWLTEHGFGGILAVGGGSVRPPRLLELQWSPEGHDSAPHIALVGKGITFDTGGISLKPADGMEMMRTDMAGGGAVIAAVLEIARLGLPVRVTALVPAAENHVSGSAYRPGDIVRHYNGATTEVGNTDAEGRMVLADALSYVAEKHAPDMVVDVATLTGAMKVALGLRTGGAFSTDDDLGKRVLAAGERCGEDWWPMPLSEDHAEDVRSEIADLRQTPPGPGGVTAALFLREFTGGLPWAHLDIAGPARADKPYNEVVPGATGFAARTLVELVSGFGE